MGRAGAGLGARFSAPSARSGRRAGPGPALRGAGGGCFWRGFGSGGAAPAAVDVFLDGAAGEVQQVLDVQKVCRLCYDGVICMYVCMYVCMLMGGGGGRGGRGEGGRRERKGGIDRRWGHSSVSIDSPGGSSASKLCDFGRKWLPGGVVP